MSPERNVDKAKKKTVMNEKQTENYEFEDTKTEGRLIDNGKQRSDQHFENEILRKSYVDPSATR